MTPGGGAIGSAIDAAMLARYVWLAAGRHREYRDALCLCNSDAAHSVYAIAPPDHALWQVPQPMPIERLRRILIDCVS